MACSKGALALTLLSTFASAGERHELVLKAFPPVQIVDLGKGCSKVWLTAELKGPETEEWYCPQITWIKPDTTQSIHQADCPPFEQRNECWPPVDPECDGSRNLHFDPTTGKYTDVSKRSSCVCNILGYPRRWILAPLCAPEHPNGEAWEVEVRLEKPGKLLRQTVRFYVK